MALVCSITTPVAVALGKRYHRSIYIPIINKSLQLHSVKTDMLPGGALSRLYIANANRQDTGNYTCMLGNEITETVVVHVLNGK